MRGVSVLIFTLVFSLTAAGGFGLDYGIDLSDEASAAQAFSSDDTADMYHDITTSLWVRSPFKDGAFSIKGGAVYDTETQKGSPSLTALNWTGFLDSQKRLSFRGGRIISDDVSGLIGRTPMDGAGIVVKQPSFIFRAAGGYTGLLFREDSSVLLSFNDLARSGDDDEILGVPRALAAVSYEPLIFERRRLVFELAGQADLWKGLDGEGEVLHTQYLSLKTDGSLVSRLYYGLSASLGIAERAEGDPGISGAGSASLTWFIPEARSFRLSASLTAATGEKDRGSFFGEGEPGSQFFAIVPKSHGQVLEAFAANNLIGSVLVSAKPVESLYLQAAVLPVMRLGDGPVNYPGSAKAGYSGTEADMVVSFAPVSDLRADIRGGVFIPADGAFIDGYDDSRWELKMRLTINL